MHHGKRRSARREREQDRGAGGCCKACQRTQDVFRAVVNERVHGDDVIEMSWWRIQHVANQEFHVTGTEIVRHAFTSEPGQRRRQVNGDHVRTAARGFDGERARAATSVEHAFATQIGREPGQQRAAHVVPTGADRGANAPNRRVRRQS